MTLKKFLIQLCILFAFLVLVVLGVMLWLNLYTNHGQELELPSYIGENIDAASEDAEDKSFKIIVNDSIHRVGLAGGEIIEQNPKGGSLVKENRKIYVTITKHEADQIPLKTLRDLYGRNYERKKKELAGMEIKSEILGHRFDPGAPGHILEVQYEGKVIVNANGKKAKVLIDKGSTLGFIISKRSGGELDVPDLQCVNFSGLDFLLDGNRLILGQVKEDGKISDRSKAKVIKQFPPHGPGSTIRMGDPVNVTISENSKYCK